MTVALILAAKGRDVTTTQPHRTLLEMTNVLAEKGIGAVIVTGGDGEVLGILSERDIVRAIGRHGVDVLKESVSKHMTSKVVTTTLEEPIDHVMEHMTSGRFRHLPVIQAGRLVGDRRRAGGCRYPDAMTGSHELGVGRLRLAIAKLRLRPGIPAVCGGAAFLAFLIEIGGLSLWIDEGHTWRYAGEPLGSLLTTVSGPPTRSKPCTTFSSTAGSASPAPRKRPCGCLRWLPCRSRFGRLRRRQEKAPGRGLRPSPGSS